MVPNSFQFSSGKCPCTVYDGEHQWGECGQLHRLASCAASSCSHCGEHSSKTYRREGWVCFQMVLF